MIYYTNVVTVTGGQTQSNSSANLSGNSHATRAAQNKKLADDLLLLLIKYAMGGV